MMELAMQVCAIGVLLTSVFAVFINTLKGEWHLAIWPICVVMWVLMWWMK